MRTIQIEKQEEPKHLLQQPVPTMDLSSWNELKVGDVVDYKEGKIVFLKLGENIIENIEKTILTAPTQKSPRLSSYNARKDYQRSNDVTFGFKSPRPVFGHTAGPVRYTVENPKGYRVLVNLGELLVNLAKQYLGEEFEKQIEHVRKSVLPEYLIGQTPFTQGVINRSNNLDWHFDRNNFDESYSIMVYILKGNLNGGELAIPSLKAFLTPVHGGVVIFKGQSLIHGVTPIKKRSPGSERMSVVYYANESLSKAESSDVELTKSKDREYRKHFKSRLF